MFICLARVRDPAKGRFSIESDIREQRVVLVGN